MVFIGAGRDSGLNGGWGSRRRVSVLVRAVITGALALGAVLGVALGAAAEEGLASSPRTGTWSRTPACGRLRL